MNEETSQASDSSIPNDEVQQIVAHAIQPYQETVSELHGKIGEARLNATKWREKAESLEKQVQDLMEIISQQEAPKSEDAPIDSGSPAKTKPALQAVDKEAGKAASNVG